MRNMIPLGAVLAVAACGPSPSWAQGGNPPDVREVQTQDGALRVERIAGGLNYPWAIAFLPDGRMLVTEKPGALRVVTRDGRVSAPVQNLPAVFARNQAGLLDVVLAPDFATSRLIYLSYAEPGPDDTASTAVARGKLNEAASALDNVTVIFRQEPKMSGSKHFGSRLAFAPDGTLFITTGERDRFDPAQDLSGHLGKVIRINRDGTVPQDNPFRGTADAKPEIWSYGHRNIQGAAIHPRSGALWIHEMGPRGGDELNVPQAGRNYGWPVVSWGDHYSGEPIPRPATRPEMAGSVYQWTPVISPSGMTFYTGTLFPDWRGDILIGGLSSRGIVRVDLEEDTVRGDHRISLGQRIRDVKQGPDGAVYALTDERQGEILRLSPAGPRTSATR